jgi:hemolysin III
VLQIVTWGTIIFSLSGVNLLLRSGGVLLSIFREPISGLIHLVSTVLALVGTVFLVIAGRGSTIRLLSFLIYGLSLVMLFTASTLYHLVRMPDASTSKLRKFDHAAIYLLIAGTYTPICLNFFNGFLQWGFLAFVWVFALAGVVVKLFVIKAPRWVTAGIYLVMGWMAVLVIKPMLAAIPAAGLMWMLAGGLFYTVGAVIYITKKLDLIPGVFGFHEVWHVFVTLGALCHFIMIYRYVAMA